MSGISGFYSAFSFSRAASAPISSATNSSASVSCWARSTWIPPPWLSPAAKDIMGAYLEVVDLRLLDLHHLLQIAVLLFEFSNHIFELFMIVGEQPVFSRL